MSCVNAWSDGGAKNRPPTMTNAIALRPPKDMVLFKVRRMLFSALAISAEIRSMRPSRYTAVPKNCGGLAPFLSNGLNTISNVFS